MKTALTIAGSDSSGGAGIQADIKTMTCQRRLRHERGHRSDGPEHHRRLRHPGGPPRNSWPVSWTAVFTDIFPDAVKTGMVSSTGLIQVIADKLRQYQARNIVVDPVMVATSGSRLISEEAVERPEERAAPPGRRPHPQHPRGGGPVGPAPSPARRTWSGPPGSIGERYGCAVLCKGGHEPQRRQRPAVAGWAAAGGSADSRIHNPNTHGTGCTLSSAIAANLAKGCDLETAVAAGEGSISRGRWPPCWTWARAAAPWTTPGADLTTDPSVAEGGGPE